MVDAKTVEFTRARNIRANLRRIFATAPRGYQASVAREAGITTVHLSRLLADEDANPTLETVEALAVALEIPFEILTAPSPTDLDLQIFSASEEKSS